MRPRLQARRQNFSSSGYLFVAQHHIWNTGVAGFGPRSPTDPGWTIRIDGATVSPPELVELGEVGGYWAGCPPDYLLNCPGGLLNSSFSHFKVNCGFKNGFKSTCAVHEKAAVVSFVRQRAPMGDWSVSLS